MAKRVLPLFYITNNFRCNLKWQCGICVYTFARRWTQCSDQEGDAAASCPSNGAQDRSMWTTREPTAGAWRTRCPYLRIGPLREQDFSFSFLHILQKTGIRCYPIGTVTKTLFLEMNYCHIVRIKKWPYVNNLKYTNFDVSYDFFYCACAITIFVFIYLIVWYFCDN